MHSNKSLATSEARLRSQKNPRFFYDCVIFRDTPARQSILGPNDRQARNARQCRELQIREETPTYTARDFIGVTLFASHSSTSVKSFSRETRLIKNEILFIELSSLTRLRYLYTTVLDESNIKEDR